MTEYIEREAALNASKIVYIEYIEVDGDGYEDGNMDDIPVVFKKDIEAIPAADVAPIKRGNWRDDVVSFYRKCSECGCCVEWNKKPFLFGDGEYNYCPNCGAKMEAQDG